MINSASGLVPGLVSVTFRALRPAEVIALAVDANVLLLEWGGDIHVPPGSLSLAEEVGARTRNPGLAVAAYGSYYRAGGGDADVAFERWLDSAVALGAPVIRIWAGDTRSAEADAEMREVVVQDTRRICSLAAAAGIDVAYEFHGGTLSDSVEAARSLLTQIDVPNLRTLWQPLGTVMPETQAAEVRAAEVRDLLPWLSHVHVYHWPGGQRVSLAKGEKEWMGPLSVLAQAGRPCPLLLEFVRDNSPEQFLADAATLRQWIARDRSRAMDAGTEK